MNKHFEDARYYLGRATETAKEGVKEELEPVRERFGELTGEEEEAEPEEGRLEKMQSEIQELEEKAEGEARRALTSARGRIERYRKDD
ncbi:MAG: hypothetical protein ABEJ68_08665 [Halobacteriaceae archaeon]